MWGGKKDAMREVKVEDCTAFFGVVEAILRDAWRAEDVDGTGKDSKRAFVAIASLRQLLLTLFDSHKQNVIELEKSFLAKKSICPDCGKGTQPDWKRCPYCEVKLVASVGAPVNLCNALVALLFGPLCTGNNHNSNNQAKPGSGECQNPWPLWERVSDIAVGDARYLVLSTLLVMQSLPLRVASTDGTSLIAAQTWRTWLYDGIGSERAESLMTSLLNFGFGGSVAGSSVGSGVTSGGDTALMLPWTRVEAKNVSLVASHLALVLSFCATSENPFVGLFRQYSESHHQTVGAAVVRLLRGKPAYERGLCWTWLLLNECPSFVSQSLTLSDGIFVRAILPFLCEAILTVVQASDEQHARAREATANLSILVILSLSAHRAFAVALNAPMVAEERAVVKGVLTNEISVSYADVLVSTICLMLGTERFTHFHECGVTILANLSSFVKGICMTCSMQCMRLFLALSSRTWFARNPLLLERLLETMSNVLSFQFEANRAFVYAMVHYRDKIDLFAATLVDGDLDYGPWEQKLANFGRNHAWFDMQRKYFCELPCLRIVVRVLQDIVPKLEKIAASSPEAIVDALGRMTVVGLLPPAKPIALRRSERSYSTDLWVYTFMWSVVAREGELLTNLPTPPLFKNAE